MEASGDFFTLVPCEADEVLPHRVKAVVFNLYACTMSRKFMRNVTLKESVKIIRVPNYFIFSIESVGMLAPRGQFLQKQFLFCRRRTET